MIQLQILFVLLIRGTSARNIYFLYKVRSDDQHSDNITSIIDNI